MDSRNGRRINRITFILLALIMMTGARALALETEPESNSESINPGIPGLEETTQGVQNEEMPDGDNEETPAEEASEILDISKTIQIKKNALGYVELSWKPVDNATSYKLYSNDYRQGTPIIISAVNGNKVSKTITDLKKGTGYVFVAEALNENNEIIAAGKIAFTTYKTVFDESKFRKLGKKKISAKKLNINLRKRVKEGYSGHSVVQGTCTDGKYAYYMMTSPKTQKGRVIKIRIKDNATVAVSPFAVNTHHANGMTYDSKRNKLVAVGYGKWRHQLVFIDPKTLKYSYTDNLKYPYKDMEGVKNGYSKNGIAAISYIEKYNVYLTRVRGGVNSGAINDIMVFDAGSLNLIGYIRTKVTAKYPGTYQAMDADEKYVYFLLSPGSRQSKNIILALDWNSEKILPVINGDVKYVKNMWHCNNNGSGKPDAVLTLGNSHEAEGLYHTVDKSGKRHFYLSEYYGRANYKTVTKKIVQKKKWKKVNKRVKVKWKKVNARVKVNGKWKTKKVWKYKWKTKKVWKYKKKVKYKKVTIIDGWARDGYVYDLGII